MLVSECTLENTSNLLLLLDKERKESKYCDFELRCGEVNRQCHGAIIRNRVTLPPAAVEDGHYECASPVSAEMLDVFLKFVYTFKVNLRMNNVRDLYRLSKEFDFEQLEELCLQFIEDVEVNNDNWSLMYEWACELDLSTVRYNVATYLVVNFVRHIEEDKFLDLDAELMKGILSSDYLLVRDERVILDTVKRWIGHKEDRVLVASELLRCVRLPMVKGIVRQHQQLITKQAFASTECQVLLHAAADYVSHPSMRWSLQSSMTRPRLGQVLTENLVAISPDSPTEIQVLNPREETWHPLSNKATWALSTFQSGDSGHRLMSVLSWDKSLFLVDSARGLLHHCMDISANCWRNVALYISRRVESMCILVQENIFVISGKEVADEAQLLTTVECTDLSSEEVSKMADLPVAVLHSCLFHIHGKIFSIGGFDGQQNVAHVQVYDCEEDEWTFMANAFPENGQGMSAACFEAVVYVLASSGKLYAFDVGSFEIRVLKDLGVASPWSSLCIYRSLLACCIPQQKKLLLLRPEQLGDDNAESFEMPLANLKGNRVFIFNMILPFQLSTPRMESVLGNQKSEVQGDVIKSLQREYDIVTSVEKWSESNFTLLHYACFKGCVDVVDAHFKRGLPMFPRTTVRCDVNKTHIDKGFCPLHAASFGGHADVVATLLDLGALIDAVDSIGRTALYIACRKGRLDAARILLKGGAQVDAATSTGWTPLVTACCYGHGEVVRLLLNYGASVNDSNNAGWTPLITASNGGKEEIVKLLLGRGANVHSTTDSEWRSNKGKVLAAQSSSLHFAAAQGHCKVVELLVASGADVNLENDKGNTPVNEACRESEVFLLLSQFTQSRSKIGFKMLLE